MKFIIIIIIVIWDVLARLKLFKHHFPNAWCHPTHPRSRA